jgi:hypothetical protein
MARCLTLTNDLFAQLITDKSVTPELTLQHFLLLLLCDHRKEVAVSSARGSFQRSRALQLKNFLSRKMSWPGEIRTWAGKGCGPLGATVSARLGFQEET